MATVTSKGQITLPKKVRDALGVEPGSEVDFAVEEGRVVMRKRISAQAFDDWEGRLRGRLIGTSVDETIEAMRGELPREDDE